MHRREQPHCNCRPVAARRRAREVALHAGPHSFVKAMALDDKRGECLYRALRSFEASRGRGPGNLTARPRSLPLGQRAPPRGPRSSGTHAGVEEVGRQESVQLPSLCVRVTRAALGWHMGCRGFPGLSWVSLCELRVA